MGLNMTPEIYVSLIIEDESVDEDVLIVLKKIGANSTWIKGQAKGNSSAIYKNNGCAFKLQSIKDVSVDYAVNYFWAYFKLEESDLFKDIVQKNKLFPVLSIAIYANDIMPSIHLESHVLRKLVYLNIGLDIDIILSE